MRRWPLLRNRDYMLFWSGQALSELGSQTSTVAYPLLVLALTGSAATAGLVGLARWLPLAILAIPAGALADRFDRKRLMIASDAIRMLGAASIVIALWVGRPPVLQIVVVAFLDGGLFVLSYICERGALPHLVPADQLQDSVAQNQARYFGASIIGPPLGGLLFAAARAVPFLTDTVSFLGSMTATRLTRPRFQHDRQNPVGTMRSGFTEGFVWMRRQPFYLTASLLFAAGNPVYSGLYLLAILLARHHGASSAAVGVMFAIVGTGGMLGAVLAAPARRRFSVRAVIVGEDWVLVLCVLLLLVAHSAWVIGLLVAAAEFSTPIGNSMVGGSRVALTPDHLQGRVAAVSSGLAMSLTWLGPLAVGFAFQSSGATTAILMVAGWTLALAVAATMAPAIRRGPPQREAPVAFR
ncbi:MAG TPA: MFS transporter [Solirubrobacteraceae bacterium]|jgi:predicted MFS family arabinose efflux permease|nr:MFS transporter [Solirubrobacteraceae bacterium]